MKPKTIRTTLVIALVIAGLADAITFYFGGLFQFEANPIYLAFKSVLIMLAFKILVIGCITWLLFCYTPQKRFIWSYALIFIALIAIFGQLLGAYSNLHTSKMYAETVGTPQEIQPLPKETAIQTFMIMNLINVYLPLILSLLSFYIWEKVYLERRD